MRFKALLVALAAIVTVSASGRAQSAAGKWDVTYPARIQNINGEMTADTGHATLTIEQKGDSIFGSWLALPMASAPPGLPAPQARTIIGTLRNGALSFSASPVEARIRRGGDEEKVMMRSFFDATLKDDAITGTMFSKSEDESINSSPMNWSAKKAAPAAK